jgi:hypothetical protein
MTGATAGAANTFAGSPIGETRPKCSAISGAVATVAAIVIAVASATPRGTRRLRSARATRPAPTAIPITAAKLSCQPGSAAARGFASSVTAAASSSAYARRGAPGERGDERRATHDPRALDRRTGAGERDVHRDQGQRKQQPAAQPEPERRAESNGQRGQQRDVLATGRNKVRERRGAEVVLHVRRQRLPLAEHHPAQQAAHASG